MSTCKNCGARLSQPFTYEGTDLCCECMSGFCSWLLEGGTVADPDMWAWLHPLPSAVDPTDDTEETPNA